MTRRVRIALVAAAAIVAVVGTLAVRTAWLGKDALAAGDAARGRGELARAIDHWRAAARCYVPLAPHVDDAYARLAATARGAEKAGEPTTALAAWRAIRSASRATTSLWTPAADLAAEADTRIAALAAADPGGSPQAGETEAARRAWHAERLAETPGPSLALTLLAAAGLLAWIGGLLWLARLARGPDRSRLAIALGLVGAGAATWTIALLVG